MSPTILVTGATGLAGANVCRRARAAGHRVRALARPGSDVSGLRALDVEVVEGDVTDPESLRAAVKGADGVVHTAAILGTPGAHFTAEQYEAVNHRGTVNVLDAAAAAGAARVVVCATNILFKARTTLTEESALLPENPAAHPYYVSKRAAYVDALARVEQGQDVVFVVPGGIYGPAPSGRRALDPSSFNAMLLQALRGELTWFAEFPLPWVTGDDVAQVALAALERGEAGARYLAMGRPEDATSVASFCNRALEIEGRPERVEDRVVTKDSPEITSGDPGMAVMGLWTYPDPLFDDRRTVEALGYRATPVDVGLRDTLRWMRSLGESWPPSAR